MRSKFHTKSVVAYSLIALVLISATYLYFANRSVNADLTTDIKKSESMSQARFQINPVSSWNAPAQVTFRVAAARYMFYGQAYGAPSGPEQSPKVTGRFFCNKPFVPGLNYPTGLYEPPNAKFEDGAPFPPTDVVDGHNGMSYTWLRGENYESSLEQFWNTTVPMTYTTTCTYNQPGEYWPLFYAEGLGAWYTQKIIITGNGYTVTPTPVASPSRSVTITPIPTPSATDIANKDFYSAGYTQVGFNQAVQTSVFTNNGFTILNYNPTIKSWDKTTSGEYLFEPYRAYYVYTPVDKYIDKINTSYSSSSYITVKEGWNFVWMNGLSYLGDVSVTYKNSNNQCVAQNMPLRTLRDNNLIYKWLYNVVDDKALTACQAFKLVSGKDQIYSGCSLTNPLLNESSYAKAKSGLWIYVWPNKIEAWNKKPVYPCY